MHPARDGYGHGTPAGRLFARRAHDPLFGTRGSQVQILPLRPNKTKGLDPIPAAAKSRPPLDPPLFHPDDRGLATPTSTSRAQWACLNISRVGLIPGALGDADGQRPKLAAQRGEVGPLDFDPLIDAQDWNVAELDIAVTDTAPGRASTTVKFTNLGKATTVLLDLVAVKKSGVFATSPGRSTASTKRCAAFTCTETVLSLTAPHNPMTQYCSAPFRKNSSGHALEYFDDHRAWHIS